MIDVVAVRALVAVEQSGSVVAAAESMGYSPSAISQQIKKLEKQAGVALLERYGRGVLLTERGKTIAERGRQILGDVELLESTLLADPQTPRGTLRLSAFSTACRGLVGPILPVLDASEVRLSVLGEDPPEAVDRVASGQADLAVVHDWQSVPLLIPEHCAVENLCLDEADVLVNTDHRLAQAAAPRRRDLVDEAWISTPDGAICNEALLQIFADLGRIPKIRMHDPDFSTHLEFVSLGVAVALVPRLGRPPVPENVVALKIPDLSHHRQVQVVYRKTMAASPAIRHVVELLHQAAARLPG
ncbi:LysR family transcriptional regulator [Psychromicrobium xiongbiense]|uniref:LysR family transcriptional regulator n=1 Tax=Psychromicrobium xiongbiense TaxID=3051184 RepID=UPI0025574AD2|nr:LysR family transcriptional regulator [Psychromicrobium sp. YIM S02556]